MEFSHFEKLNTMKWRKMTRIGRKPRRLVIHPCFKNFVSRIVDSSLLQRDFEKIHFLDDSFDFPATANYAFLIPPLIPAVQRVADARVACGTKFQPFIELWFQPRINDLVSAFLLDSDLAPASLLQRFPCEKLSAASQGARPRENFEVYNLEMDVVPLDNDVLTIFSPYAFFRTAYQHDLTVVGEVRNALEIISSYQGFVSISAIGNLSVAVARTLPPPAEANTTHLIIIDREADLLTPLITQMNYEGLIAENFGIDCGCVAVPSDKGNQLQLLSSASDATFAQLRSMTHQEASDEITRRMAQVSQTFASQPGRSFEDGVQAFRNMAHVSLENQTLADHINLAQRVIRMMEADRFFKRVMNVEAQMLSLSPSKSKEIVQEMLEYGTDMRQVVRLMCLDSLLRGGTPEYAKWVNMLNFNYGVQMVPFLLRLQETGLLVPGGGSKWSNVIKAFQLYSPDWEQTDDQAAALYLGYAPLSVRYVQRVVNGDVASMVRSLAEIGQKCSEVGQTEAKNEGTFLVCFIGGCTHSELNTLRRLAERQNMKYQILTTHLFSSNDFFDRLAFGIPGYEPIIPV
jgi:hypothetical protein